MVPLSIGEIKRVLQSIYALSEFDDSLLEETYLRFLEIKERQREEIPTFVEYFREQSKLDPENDADFFTLILGLSAMSAYLKNTVQTLLEARYPDVDAEKQKEEQLRKEELKRQKEEKKAAKVSKKEENTKEKEHTDGGEA